MVHAVVRALFLLITLIFFLILVQIEMVFGVARVAIVSKVAYKSIVQCVCVCVFVFSVLGDEFDEYFGCYVNDAEYLKHKTKIQRNFNENPSRFKFAEMELINRVEVTKFIAKNILFIPKCYRD